MIKVICVCGARPNFMKIAPLVHAFKRDDIFDILLVHTGQHYDDSMSRQFFDDLDIPKPDINLEVGSGSNAVQTATIMAGFEPVVRDYTPDSVIVVGDVNSTIACGIVAAKMGVKLVHIEAGQRSFDRRMPEEINRVLTDSISDLLFVSEPSGLEILKKEGIPQEKVFYVGNIMIDTLLANRQKAQRSTILDTMGLRPHDYILVTLHRPGNVDKPEVFGGILSALEEIQKIEVVVFPIHPRTRANIENKYDYDRLKNMPNVKMLDPLGYLDFLCLMDNAKLVMTDSGGIQAETTPLRVLCMTVRDTTEWPITLTQGTNHLVPPARDGIVSAYGKIIQEKDHHTYQLPDLWDGKTADRIVKILKPGPEFTEKMMDILTDAQKEAGLM